MRRIDNAEDLHLWDRVAADSWIIALSTPPLMMKLASLRIVTENILDDDGVLHEYRNAGPSNIRDIEPSFPMFVVRGAEPPAEY